MKIISGGQTGVDRAALDFALTHGKSMKIAVGGWCPKGRRAEDGVIPDFYPLKEAPRRDYPFRTLLNVVDSDGTLIFFRSHLKGGSALTLRHARKYGKPFLAVNLLNYRMSDIRNWIAHHEIQTLNIAGPRESESQGIHQETMDLLYQLWHGQPDEEAQKCLPFSVEERPKPKKSSGVSRGY